MGNNLIHRQTAFHSKIREVKVYESLSETNKWGQQGRAGVIEIITLNLGN